MKNGLSFLKRSKEDQDGFTMLDSVITSTLVLTLSTGIGFATYDTIQDNIKQKTVEAAASTGFASGLANLNDFDEETTVEKALEELHAQDDKISYTYEGDNEKTLCVTAEMLGKRGKVFSSTVGNCNSSNSGSEDDNDSVLPPVIQKTVTRINYKCDEETTGRLPFQRLADGNIKPLVQVMNGNSVSSTFDVDNVFEQKSGSPSWFAGEVNFKPNVSYSVSYGGRYDSLEHESNEKLKDCVTEVERIDPDTSVNKISNLGGKNLYRVPAEIPSTVTSINYIFDGAEKFNDASVTNWDVKNVDSMISAFNGASSFNQPLGDWDVSEVVDADMAFITADAFNQDLSSWRLDSLRHSDKEVFNKNFPIQFKPEKLKNN